MISTTIEEMETPALLIDLDILEYNIATMANFINDKRAKLRPHFKTHKCPTISHDRGRSCRAPMIGDVHAERA